MTRRRVRGAFAFCIGLGLCWPAAIPALTIYPVDRAEILAGSQFDFKVEFDGVIAEGDARVTVNGGDPAALFGRPAEFTAREKGVDHARTGISLPVAISWTEIGLVAVLTAVGALLAAIPSWRSYRQPVAALLRG